MLTVIHFEFQHLATIKKIDFEPNFRIKQESTQLDKKLECYDLFILAKLINLYTNMKIRHATKTKFPTAIHFKFQNVFTTKKIAFKLNF